MFRKTKAIFVVILFLLAQSWVLYITFSFPVTGINVDKKNNGIWYVSKLEYAGSYSNVEVGDMILKVNDKDASQYFTINKWRSLSQYKSLTIDRNGLTMHIESTRYVINNAYSLSMIGEVLSLFIAFLLFRKSYGSISAKYLSYVFINIGIVFMSLSASIRGDTLGKAMVLSFMILLPVMFLKFLTALIGEKSAIDIFRSAVKAIFRIFVGASFFMLVLFTNFSFTYVLYRIAAGLTILFFVTGIVVNLTFLAAMYFKYRNRNSYVSLLTKTIWMSLFISFSPICLFSLLPNLLFGREWLNSFYMSWFIFILPLTFAYLIIAERLYDIDVLVRRILLNITISLVPCAGLTAIVRLLFPDETDARRLTIIFVLLLACMTFVLYSFEYFTTKLQPLLFPRKHQLQVALKKISMKLRAIASFRDLKDIILVDIVNTLQVVGGAIVIKYNDTMETISEGSVDHSQIQSLVQSGERRSVDYSLIEINRHEEYTSYLIIGRKITGTMLGTEELQWIGFITSYLAVSLENVYLIRKLTLKLEQLALQIQNEDAALQLVWFRKLMFELQERERTRIATDLHDTTMQDLFFLKSRLHGLLEKNVYNDEDRKQMESILDYIDIINANLRQSCFELHPYMLKEIGLVKTIERLVAFEAPISPFELTFRSGGADIIEQKDLETKRHIFRMVQELINNAKKHAEASRVRLVLTAMAGSIYFEYEDDGVGFDPQRRAPGEIGGSGTGMDQIRSRIFSLNGQFELMTGKGKGVKIVATIPVQEGLIA